MRTELLIPGLAACIGLSTLGLAHACDYVTDAALTEEARLAIRVRCEPKPEVAARECHSMLKRLYLAGSLDPDKTLRSYCDSVKNAGWGDHRNPPPRLCIERYGGWNAG